MAGPMIGNPETQGLIRRSKYLEDAIQGLSQTPQSQFDTPAGAWGNILSKAIMAYSGNEAAKRAEGAQKADQDRLTSAILGTPEKAIASDLGQAKPFDLTPQGMEGRVQGVEDDRMRAIAEMGGPMAALQYQQGQAATKREDDRWNKTFGFQQDRATAQDNQFDKTFGAGREDAARGADQWRMAFDQSGEQFGSRLAQDADQFGKTYGETVRHNKASEAISADTAEARVAAAEAKANGVFGGPQLATIYNKNMDALDDVTGAQKDLDFIAGQARAFVDKTKGDEWIQGDNFFSDMMQAGSMKTTGLKAITDSIAPLMRRPGSGSSSDRDIDMFRRAAVNINNTPEANQRFADGADAMADRNRAYSQFLNDAITPEDPQSRQKAQKLWNMYATDQPIFDQQSGAVLQPQTFSDWLGEHMGASQPPGAPVMTAPQAAQPVRVTSKAQRDALPAGTQYIAPDGSVMVKK